MSFKAIDFYFFSGTGNTLLVIKTIKAVFENHNIPIRLHRIEATDPSSVQPEHAVGLAFPVAEQATYPFVWDFIRALPPSDGAPVFMVDTLFYYSGGIVGPVKKIVTDKGYVPLGAKEIVMPNNLFPKAIDEAKTRQKVQRGLQDAEQYAYTLLHGTTSWGRLPWLSDFMGMFSQKEWTWRFLRKMYPLTLDPQKCSKCGLCVKLCPINNIRLEDTPVYGHRCVLCMRCVSFCPTHAIYATKVHGMTRPHTVYKATKASELLKL